MAFNETDQYIPGDVGGACFFCGSSQRSDRGQPERLFRCDADVFDGNIVICETCVSDVSTQLGWISPAKAAALKDRNTDLAKQVKEATAALGAAMDTVDALRAYDEAGLSA